MSDAIKKTPVKGAWAIKKTPVKGGWISRDSQSGQFVEVSTSKGSVKASEKSKAVVKEASGKRSAALKRLADR